jgi:hypothetical protein
VRIGSRPQLSLFGRNDDDLDGHFVSNRWSFHGRLLLRLEISNLAWKICYGSLVFHVFALLDTTFSSTQCPTTIVHDFGLSLFTAIHKVRSFKVQLLRGLSSNAHTFRLFFC